MNDEVRGTAPALSTKDVILQIWSDVRQVKTAVDVLVSQDLNDRVRCLESAREQEKGRESLIKAVFGASALAAILGVVSLINLLSHGI